MALLELREHWYVAAPSAALGRRRPHAARVLDQDLVLFRDGRGVAHALLDRCPHRGVPLSMGRVQRGTVACRYHGWRFDGDGRCVHVPSLRAGEQAPTATRVPAVRTAEGSGYVWVWMGAGAPGPVPVLAGFDRLRWDQGTIPMQASAVKGIENHFDIVHAFFTHPWTHPHFLSKRLTGFSELTDELRLTDDGFMIFRPVTASEDEAPLDPPRGRIRFHLPDTVHVWFKRGPLERMMWLHFVPTGPQSCRMEWLWSRPLPLGPRVRFRRDEPALFRQDRLIMEGAQRAYGDDSLWAAWERSVEADRTTNMVRTVVRLAAEGRWEEERRRLPQRVMVTATR